MRMSQLSSPLGGAVKLSTGNGVLQETRQIQGSDRWVIDVVQEAGVWKGGKQTGGYEGEMDDE